MKNAIYTIITCAIVASIVGMLPQKRGDAYVRDRVYLLHSSRGSCTGVQIRTKSGLYYILTAAHCRAVLENDKTMVKSESGADTEVSFVAEDPKSDLMLLTAAGRKVITIGDGPAVHDHLHSMTHGKGMPSYRTDGEMLMTELMQVGLFPILTDDAAKECASQPKYSVMPGWLGLPFCVLNETVFYTTVMVVPGSSGGPILNERDELIGIVSASSGDMFSGIVTTKDINNFLKDR